VEDKNQLLLEGVRRGRGSILFAPLGRRKVSGMPTGELGPSFPDSTQARLLPGHWCDYTYPIKESGPESPGNHPLWESGFAVS
jgi:hypothetical protein